MQAKAAIPDIKQLPTKHKVSLAYTIHWPHKTVNPNINIKPREPVIFLHGVFGSKKNYRDYCQTIANQNYTPVYSLDFRNHGESEHAFPLVNYSTLTQDVVDFIHEHKLEKVDIVGYSLGAKVALLTLLKHPELCRSGVIIGNAPIKTPQVKVYLKAFIKALKALGDKRPEIKSNDKAWRAKARDVMRKYIPDGDILHYLLRNIDIRKPKNITEYKPGTINFSMPISHFDNKVVEDIADWPEEEVEGLKFEGPVRVIRGTQSVFINDKGLAAYQKHFPNYTLTNFNSNHLIWAERPLQVTKVVSDFLKKTRLLEMDGSAKALEESPKESYSRPPAHQQPLHKNDLTHIDVGALPVNGAQAESTQA